MTINARMYSTDGIGGPLTNHCLELSSQPESRTFIHSCLLVPHFGILSVKSLTLDHGCSRAATGHLIAHLDSPVDDRLCRRKVSEAGYRGGKSINQRYRTP